METVTDWPAALKPEGPELEQVAIEYEKVCRYSFPGHIPNMSRLHAARAALVEKVRRLIARAHQRGVKNKPTQWDYNFADALLSQEDE